MAIQTAGYQRTQRTEQNHTYEFERERLRIRMQYIQKERSSRVFFVYGRCSLASEFIGKYQKRCLERCLFRKYAACRGSTAIAAEPRPESFSESDCRDSTAVAAEPRPARPSELSAGFWRSFSSDLAFN